MPETEVFETFGTYLARLEKVLPPLDDKPIIVSTEVKIPVLKDGNDESITKTPIAWPLYQYNMFYIVNVPAGKHVAPHSHTESVFRLVMKGSLLVNKVIRIDEGQWFVIRKGTTYQIDTDIGYTTLASYTSQCQTDRGTLGSHLVVDE